MEWVRAKLEDSTGQYSITMDLLIDDQRKVVPYLSYYGVWRTAGNGNYVFPFESGYDVTTFGWYAIVEDREFKFNFRGKLLANGVSFDFSNDSNSYEFEVKSLENLISKLSLPTVPKSP